MHIMIYQVIKGKYTHNIEKLYNNILKIDDVWCDIVGEKRCKGMNSSSHVTKLTLIVGF